MCNEHLRALNPQIVMTIYWAFIPFMVNNPM